MSHKNIVGKLHQLSLELEAKSLEVASLSMEASKYTAYVGDLGGSILDKMAAATEAVGLRIQRSNVVSKLNNKRREFYEFIEAQENLFYEAQKALQARGEEAIRFPNLVNAWDYGLNNSTDNEDWADHFFEVTDELSDALSKTADLCSKVADKLEKIA